MVTQVALRRTLQEPDVTQENVCSFPGRVLDDLLGDMYFIECVQIDATAFGLPATRKRQFMRMRHKAKILSEVSPLSRFAKRFYRIAAFHWKEHLGCIKIASMKGCIVCHVCRFCHLLCCSFSCACACSTARSRVGGRG